MLGGALVLGMAPAMELSRRLSALEAWGEALALLERELAFSSPDMPVLLSRVAVGSRSPVREWGQAVLKSLDRLGEKDFGEIWCEGLEAVPGALFPSELKVLAQLGDTLGRYDREAQMKALALTREELSRLAWEAREERREKGKAWGALGLSLGAAVLILLL